MSTSAHQTSNSRPQSRLGRSESRPTTPLRQSSRSRSRGRNGTDFNTPLENLSPFFAELEDAMHVLNDNFSALQMMHENINRFNESFSAMLYGLQVNAFCVDWPETPIPESYQRAEEEAREAERLAALQQPIRSEHDAETTFMTNDTFVEQPVTPAARNPKTPGRKGQPQTGRQRGGPGTSRGGAGASTGGRGGGSGSSSRGRGGSGIARPGSGSVRGGGSRYSTR